MRKVNVSVIESIADLKTAPRLTLTRQSQLGSLTPTKMVQCYSCDGVPLKYKKKGGPPVYQHGLFKLSIGLS